MQHWLTRPVYALRVDPGEREPYEEAAGSGGAASSHMPRYYRTPRADEHPLAPNPSATANDAAPATGRRPLARCGRLALSEVLAELPVALLTPTEADP